MKPTHHLSVLTWAKAFFVPFAASFYFAFSAEWFFKEVLPWAWGFLAHRDGIRGNPGGGLFEPLLTCGIAIFIWLFPFIFPLVGIAWNENLIKSTDPECKKVRDELISERDRKAKERAARGPIQKVILVALGWIGAGTGAAIGSFYRL